VATEAGAAADAPLEAAPDHVYTPILADPARLRATLDRCRAEIPARIPLHAQAWLTASYRPSPTIVEAARTLYAQHSVEAIARYDAGAQNLAITSRRIEELIEDARRLGRKSICFVTGVPGAGKTLVGLNVATRRSDESDLTHAVFLSGNGPLVAVLREALARDEMIRRKAKGERVRKGEVRNGVESFIQNVHHFRDEALKDPEAPDEHVVIFDEAQRAWNRQQTSNFMRRKKSARATRPPSWGSSPFFARSASPAGGGERHTALAVTAPPPNFSFMSSATLSPKRPSRAAKSKLAGPAIHKRLVDIELATVSALRALQMDIDGDAGTPSATVLKRARAALR
jgi:hypothetical protein